MIYFIRVLFLFGFYVSGPVFVLIFIKLNGSSSVSEIFSIDAIEGAELVGLGLLDSVSVVLVVLVMSGVILTLCHCCLIYRYCFFDYLNINSSKNYSNLLKIQIILIHMKNNHIF
jgi:hypothetical protein